MKSGPCRIIDTTLREGIQTPGVVFGGEQKLMIIDGLAAVGVTEVELGIAAPLAENCAALNDYCKSCYPYLRTSLWGRCREDDIDCAAAAGVDTVSLSIPVSDLLLEKKLGKDRRWAHQMMIRALQYASRRGLSAAIGFEDATRADPVYLLDMACCAEAAGAWRVRLADTVGVATPHSFSRLVGALCDRLHHAELGVHTHNDFGMATANALAAYTGGATWVDVTVLGLGERCGCARLEEVIGYLSLVGGDAGFHPEHLTGLAQRVSALVGRTIPGSTPIIGADIFTCETGLHLQGLLADPDTYEPYSPYRVGAQRTLLFGRKVGRRALARSSGAVSLANLRAVHEEATARGRALAADEVAELLRGR